MEPKFYRLFSLVQPVVVPLPVRPTLKGLEDAEHTNNLDTNPWMQLYFLYGVGAGSIPRNNVQVVVQSRHG